MQDSIAAQDRNWAIAAHLSALVAIAGMPFGHILGPLVVYLIKGHESEFVAAHARASLNYQITLSVLAIIAILVGVAVTIGFAVNASTQSTVDVAGGLGVTTVWVAVGIAALLILTLSILFIIMGSLAASEGRLYTYPFAIRFLR